MNPKTGWTVLFTALILVSAGLLLRSQNTPPTTEIIRIAAGSEGGLYYRFATLLKEKLEEKGQYQVQLVATEGSVDNAKQVRDKKVDLALLQAGSDNLKGFAVVTPVFIEPVYILTNPNSNIESVADLQEKRINLGPAGSGSHHTALRILQHFEIEQYHEVEGYMSDVSIKQVDAFVAVGGLLNEDVKTVVKRYNLQVLPLPNAQALTLKHPYLKPFAIPNQIFSVSPPIPLNTTPSVSSTAMLICNEKFDSDTIKAVLDAIYNTNLRTHFPLMMTPDEVKAWTLFPIKPASLEFLDPYKGIGIFADFAESLAAIKELIFALCAMAYFSWLGIKKRKESREQAEYAKYKEHLDWFLDETVKIEWKLNYAKTREEYTELLDQACELKLKALTELTDESLRGDSLFAIFISQSGNLISRLESRLISSQVIPDEPRS